MVWDKWSVIILCGLVAVATSQKEVDPRELNDYNVRVLKHRYLGKTGAPNRSKF